MKDLLFTNLQTNVNSNNELESFSPSVRIHLKEVNLLDILNVSYTAEKEPPLWQRVLGVPQKIESLSNGLINHDNMGILYGHPTDWAKRIMTKEELNKTRQNLYDHFRPFGYSMARLQKAAAAARGYGNDMDDEWKRSVERNVLSIPYSVNTYPSIRDEAFATYLLIPKEKQRVRRINYLEPAIYRPTIGNPNRRVFQFNRKANPYFEENLVNAWEAANKGKGYVSHPKDIRGNTSSVYRSFRPGKTRGYWTVDSNKYGYLGNASGDPSDAIAGTWTLSSGVDPQKGQYISFYDEYDLNPSIAGRSAGHNKWYGAFPIKEMDMSGGVGEPFSIYDRVYLDDYHGVHSAPEPDSYFGGWLAPAIIMPSYGGKGR